MDYKRDHFLLQEPLGHIRVELGVRSGGDLQQGTPFPAGLPFFDQEFSQIDVGFHALLKTGGFLELPVVGQGLFLVGHGPGQHVPESPQGLGGGDGGYP